jgi:hypothetical protein
MYDLQPGEFDRQMNCYFALKYEELKYNFKAYLEKVWKKEIPANQEQLSNFFMRIRKAEIDMLHRKESGSC